MNAIQDHLWVFGYGSLIWKPNFVFDERVVGSVKGYKRRFWQGSVHHRGSKGRPGRVVTIVKDFNSRVYGVAYRISGRENIMMALEHLSNREQAIGGYQTRIVYFFPKDTMFKAHAIPVRVFYASPDNRYFLGSRSDNDICLDIFLSFGTSGSNIEYLFRLADFMRSEVQGENDEHLFAIENLVRIKLNLCTKDILSWLELIKSTQFLNKLNELGKENSKNLVAV